MIDTDIKSGRDLAAPSVRTQLSHRPAFLTHDSGPASPLRAKSKDMEARQAAAAAQDDPELLESKYLNKSFPGDDVPTRAKARTRGAHLIATSLMRFPGAWSKRSGWRSVFCLIQVALFLKAAKLPWGKCCAKQWNNTSGCPSLDAMMD